MVKKTSLLLFISSSLLLFYIFRLDLVAPDSNISALHLQAFYRLLSKGFLVPRWVSQFNQGYGHPDLITIPPLKNYLGALVHSTLRLSFPRISSIFVFNLNIIIFPLVLLFIYRLSQKFNSQRLVLICLSLSVLILNNSPIQFLYFFLPLFLFCCFFSFTHPSKLKLIKGYLLSLVAAVSLTTFFWLPAVTEAKDIKVFSANTSAILARLPVIQPQALSILSNQDKIEIVQQHTSPFLWYGYELVIPQSSQFQFHTFYYPGWQVFFDSEPIIIEPANPDNYGLINFSLPASPGDYHFLEIVFNKTKPRILADSISLITLAILISFAGYVYFKNRS